jgi:hypothetical protein
LNFDGGRPEYYGKYFCKDLTTRTQRRQISLGKQTAQRYFEMSCVLEAERVLAQSKTSTYLDNNKYQYFPLEEAIRHDNMEHTLKARLCVLSLDPNNAQRLIYKWPNKEYAALDGFFLDDEVYLKIASRIWGSRNGGRLHRDGYLQCFSECILPNGQTVRSHPFYNSERPWYDWVTVRWDDYAETLPAKVLLFFRIEEGPIENYNIVGGIRVPHMEQFLQVNKSYAIVHTVTGDIFTYRGNRFHLKSNIAVRYMLENDLRLIEVDSIDALSLVLKDDIGTFGNVNNQQNMHSIVLFKDRTRWKGLFLDL